MSKKRKRTNDTYSDTVTLPQTFRDITNLSNADLNGILRQFDLPAKGKRTHRYTLLARHLNIKTHDAGDQDPFLQTLQDIASLKDGWTKDIHKVPHITLDQIKRYLYAAHDIAEEDAKGCFEEYSENSLRAYKALRAYDLWESGHIGGYMFNPLTDIEHYTALTCLANPSGDTSGTQYSVTVVISDNGEPIGASCTCVAGKGEACTHIAGLLFGIEDFVARGYRDLPGDDCPTEKLCRWIVPKGPKVDPKPICEVSVKKNIPEKPKKEKKISATSYEPLPEQLQPVNFDCLTVLHHTLSLNCPDLPWVKAVAPAIVQKLKPNDQSLSAACGPSKLPDIAGHMDDRIVPGRELSVTTSVEPLTLKQKAKCSVSEASVKYSEEEKRVIEKLTRKQKDSVHWLKYRQGIITSSNFNRVASHARVIARKGTNQATVSLVAALLGGSSFKGNKATRYGQRQEPKAVAEYLALMKSSHKRCSVEECGLVISKEFDYLGTSPDGIFKCACHGKRLVEVKCPYTLVDSSRTINSLDFLNEDENGHLTLKEHGNTYYDQIQGQMGITGIYKCDLVVYDGHKVEVIDVAFNSDYWLKLAADVNNFYLKFVYIHLTSGGENPNSASTSRKEVQLAVSAHTERYPCGKCGILLAENVIDNSEASINCECDCKCRQWFHWRCVNFTPDPELDSEPPWFCPKCVRNCDIVF